MFDFLVRSAQAQVDIKEVFEPAKSFPTLGVLINVLLPNVLTIAGVIMFVAVVITGFTYITHAGSGDSKQMEKDQAALTGAVTGLILIFGAYFIIQIIETLLGYKLLTPNLPQ